MPRLLLLLLSSFVAVFGQKCGPAVMMGMGLCLKNELDQLALPKPPTATDMKIAIKECLETAGCDTMEEPGISGLPFGVVKKEEIVAAVEICKRETMETVVKPQLTKCMRKQIPDFELPSVDFDIVKQMLGGEEEDDFMDGPPMMDAPPPPFGRKGRKGAKGRKGKMMQKLEDIISNTELCSPESKVDLKRCLLEKSRDMFPDCKNPIEMVVEMADKKEEVCSKIDGCKTQNDPDDCLGTVKEGLCGCVDEFLGEDISVRFFQRNSRRRLPFPFLQAIHSFADCLGTKIPALRVAMDRVRSGDPRADDVQKIVEAEARKVTRAKFCMKHNPCEEEDYGPPEPFFLG